MNFKRLEILSNEVEIINAIMDNKQNISFNLLFEGQEEMSKEFKLDKICEILYKVLKSAQVLRNVQEIDEANLLRMFEEYYGNSNIGAFCIEFIKLNIEADGLELEEKLERLLALNPDHVSDAQIKIDYLQMTLTLLLNQFPLNFELINQYNAKLKELLVSAQAIEEVQDNEEE